LDAYDNEWQAARNGVAKERGPSTTGGEETITDQLQQRDRHALIALLEGVPPVILSHCLQAHKPKRS
jgi:hypothetical protein